MWLYAIQEAEWSEYPLDNYILVAFFYEFLDKSIL